jgi:CRP-like cAMP-binding protein/uncharacterized protein (DUF697 family)
MARSSGHDMSIATLDPTATLDHALEFASKNLRVETLLIKLGLDPSNITYDALFNRLLDIAVANITFAHVLGLIGGIFLISTFVVRTIVLMRVLCIISIVFFLGSAALSGSVPNFFMYLLALPVNVVRLVQIRNLVKRARSSAQGVLSLDWLRPFMTPRSYRKGDVLFRKGDPATEMFLTVTGKFLVTEINIEIPPERILGELGFLSPNNHRTQSVECIEDGEVLTVSYEKLHEIYLENPEFGYFFLRLTSDRLLQNHARLEKLVEQHKAALAEIEAPAGAAKGKERSLKAAVLTIKNIRTAGIGANRRQKISAATRVAVSASSIVGMMTGRRADPAAATDDPLGEPVDPAEIEAAKRRVRAFAIVEHHVNYSAIGGFIPVPVVNAAAIAAVIVRMVNELSTLYGVPFKRNRAFSAAAGLLGGIMPTRLAAVTMSAIVNVVPGYNLVGLAVTSVTAAACARKIGYMLVDEFEHEAARERERIAWERNRRWINIWPLGARGRAASNGGIRRWLRS